VLEHAARPECGRLLVLRDTDALADEIAGRGDAGVGVVGDLPRGIGGRLGKTGIATMSMPRERAMRYDDSDISETSNSKNLSWR
jgi:hypothetical protein